MISKFIEGFVNAFEVFDIHGTYIKMDFDPNVHDYFFNFLQINWKGEND